MVILGTGEGRLANRLLLSSHALAYTIRKKEKFIDLSFTSYSHLFELKSSSKNIKTYFIKSKWLSVFISKFLSFIILSNDYLKSHFIDYYKIGWTHTEIENLKRHKNGLLFLSGEGFRDTHGVKRHRSQICGIFEPNKEYQIKADQIIRKIKNDNNTLIGVHIRRGDYREVMKEYCYDDKEYCDILMQINSRGYLNVPVTYLICSDEKINKNAFDDFNTYFSEEDPIVDLLLLSKCDYIIGPPSTFSLWASYYGKVPLLTIKNNRMTFDLHDFKISEL
jgi:hypothetical protein